MSHGPKSLPPSPLGKVANLLGADSQRLEFTTVLTSVSLDEYSRHTPSLLAPRDIFSRVQPSAFSFSETRQPWRV